MSPISSIAPSVVRGGISKAIEQRRVTDIVTGYEFLTTHSTLSPDEVKVYALFAPNNEAVGI